MSSILRPRSSRLAAPAAVALAALVAACGGGAAATAGPGGATAAPPAGGGAGSATQAPPPASSVAACDLLTDEEVKEVTSYEVLSKEPGPQQGIYENGCDWKLESGNEGIPWEIVVGVVSPGGRSYYDRYFSIMDWDSVDGVDADIAVEEDLSDSYMAVKGDTMVDIQYIELKMGGGNPEGKALELLKRIVARLG